MFEDPVPADVKQALIDRYDPWELVELLDVSTETLVEALSEDIAEKLAKVRTELGMELDEEDNDNDG
jgi:hypothetical protein